MSDRAAQDRRQPGAMRRLVMAAVIASILGAQLVAMQFTDEVAWTGYDFVVAGMLLIGAAATYELLALRLSKRHRILAGPVLLMVVAAIWADGAVGVF